MINLVVNHYLECDLHRLITQQASLFPKRWNCNMTNTDANIKKGACLQPIFLKAQVRRKLTLFIFQK
jgi:hypothetical protein